MLNTCEKSRPEKKTQFIYKRFYGEEQIELFKHEPSQTIQPLHTKIS